MNNSIDSILSQISNVVIGKPKEIRLALACLLSRGHLLIEDLPGMGKTTLAQALATSLGLSYQRTQFTSDLLPADIIGVSIFDQSTQSFSLHKGAIFNQVVLADEINRASPKTQSALLEAMEEKQVSIDGNTYDLPEPFFVIATQNPLFHAGTYPLPESQLDRFMMRLSLGFPDVEAEKAILSSSDGREKISELKVEITKEVLDEIQILVSQVNCSDAILEYVIALCHKSRDNTLKVNPLSPRAGKALLAAAKAWAYIEGRSYVIPEDIQAVFTPVCEHRLDAGNMESSDNTMSEQILKLVDPLKPF